MSETAIIDVETAAESARTGDMDAAIDMAAQVLHATDRSGGAMYRGAAGTVLVTSLLAPVPKATGRVRRRRSRG
jgi:dihydroxyacetone kinase